VPHSPSQNRAASPSRLLALVCAAVVAAFDRRWLARPVAALRTEADPPPETLSRLKARVLPAFEECVACAHRRGRRPADRDAEALRARLAVAETELAVAASVIAERGVRNPGLQDRLVAAAERLRAEHGVGWRRFSAALGIAERTFRSWRRRPPAPPRVPEPPPAPSPPRPRGEGRFALELCPPDLQALADTTHVRAFGVDLRLVATQDPGRRDQDPFASFAVGEEENAELVIQAVTEALAGLPGAQLLVDQGTPYLAEATREACERLRIDHEPQKEATPTEKSTLERAFRTVKDALATLFSLTDRLADAVPSLRRPELARAFVSLLVGVFLRVRRAGAAPHPLEGRDRSVLEDVVAATRERACAERRSRKLFLARLHDEYHLEEHVSRDAFVRAHRHHALEDLVGAEEILRRRGCRCDARRCDRFFTGILRNVADRGRARRARERADREADAHRRDRDAAFEAHEALLVARPELRLHEALDALLAQWIPRSATLLFGGCGWARAQLRRAIDGLRRSLPLVWEYELDAAWKKWCATSGAPHGAWTAISRLLDTERARIRSPEAPPRATLRPQAQPENTRSPPPPGLTI